MAIAMHLSNLMRQPSPNAVVQLCEEVLGREAVAMLINEALSTVTSTVCSSLVENGVDECIAELTVAVVENATEYILENSPSALVSDLEGILECRGPNIAQEMTDEVFAVSERVIGPQLFAEIRYKVITSTLAQCAKTLEEPSLHHHCTITAPSLHHHCTITASWRSAACLRNFCRR